MNKDELRLFIKQRLVESNRSSSFRDNSKLIITELVKLPEFKSARRVFCYVSIKHEVDTIYLIEQMLASGKEVYVPVCQNKDMVMCGIKSLDDLNDKNCYNIPEPDNFCEMKGVDIAIVPGIAFDIKGNRLGRGGGFYDRLDVDCLRIALAFECQIVNEIPVDAWDKKVDIIITEERLIRPTKKV
ncbi:5-formyltetrahydrofolate cyclo-ligase [Candidatus Woesearchaeota archaeon]|nr:5-formyltetrahydrofolate cyclo-ligase [Candidatus Woesearchaeota archaeon]